MNTLKVLREEVNRKTGLDITKSTRERPYAYSRFLYYKLAKELTPAGFSDIAKSVGVTHATVIHGINAFDNFFPSVEPSYMSMYYDIKAKFTTSEEITEFNDPISFWKGKYTDAQNECNDRIQELEDKYHALGEQYTRVVNINRFMKGVLRQRGIEYKFMTEEVKEFEPL